MATLTARSLLTATCLLVAIFPTSVTTQASAVPPPAPGSTGVAVQAGQTTTGIDGALHRAGTNGRISGRLVDPDSRQPPARQVYIYSAGGDQVAKLTNLTDGRFSAWLPPSRKGYAVCVFSRYRYVDKCLPNVPWTDPWPGRAAPGSRYYPVNAGKQRKLGAVHLHQGGRITGVIRNNAGEAYDGAAHAMSVSHPRITAEALALNHGRYTFDQLPPSPKGWRICADRHYGLDNLVGRCHGGMVWSGAPKLPSQAKPVFTSAGHTTKHINLKLLRGGVIQGIVRSADTGKPIDHVRVAAIAGSHRIVSREITDESGRYTLSGLTSGRYHVCAVPDAGTGAVHNFGGCYRGTHWDFGLKASGAEVSVRRTHTTSGVSVRLDPAARVTGTVDGPDGQPISGRSRVVIFDGNGRQVASGGVSNGVYRAHGLTAGSYVICAKNPPTGDAPACANDVPWAGGQTPPPDDAARFDVPAGKSIAGPTIMLGLGGAIRGTVHAAGTGAALRDKAVSLYDANGAFIERTSAAAGKGYEFADLAPGEGYQVCFSGDSASVHDKPGQFGYQGSCYQDAAWPH